MKRAVIYQNQIESLLLKPEVAIAKVFLEPDSITSEEQMDIVRWATHLERALADVASSWEDVCQELKEIQKCSFAYLTSADVAAAAVELSKKTPMDFNDVVSCFSYFIKMVQERNT